MNVHYVKMDPTGNITILVTDPIPREKQPALANRLMSDPDIGGEQVGFLETPEQEACACRLQMMGGEFCGNASMSLGVLLLMGRLADGEEKTVPLEVSGTKGVLPCRIKRLGNEWQGTVRMPAARTCEKKMLAWDGRRIPVTVVRMEGIAHVILDGTVESDTEAESILRAWAAYFEEEAVGLLQWNDREKYMRPLILVKPTGTAVWENGCGSGSAAIGIRAARENGQAVTEVKQPGGMIRTEVLLNEKNEQEITITGKVRLIGSGVKTIP